MVNIKTRMLCELVIQHCTQHYFPIVMGATLIFHNSHIQYLTGFWMPSKHKTQQQTMLGKCFVLVAQKHTTNRTARRRRLTSQEGAPSLGSTPVPVSNEC